jgi:hypothetical protein
MKRTVFVATAAALVSLGTLGSMGCKKDPPPPPPVVDAPTPPAAKGPPPGSDGDTKRIAALELAVKIDGALATLEHGEKKLPDGRKVEAWIKRDAKPPVAQKVVVTTVDDKGAPNGVVDMYYDEKGYLTFACAQDGLFIFSMESLALWLDADQKVKRGLNPAAVKPRTDALLKDNSAALTTFGLR